jgi:flagellar basal body rod protein FlgG
MSSSTNAIQSLRAVDAWIDVINANINGGVRTAFKSSRLKFGGSNVDVQRTGNATSLPLQIPEPSLTTVNTIIDFSQGAVTTSTETSHVAIQGPGFFKLARVTDDPTDPNTTFYYTRDGEFHWMSMPAGTTFGTGGGTYTTIPGNTYVFLVNSAGLAVVAATTGEWVKYSLNQGAFPGQPYDSPSGVINGGSDPNFLEDIAVVDFPQKQGMQFSRYGSTIFTAPPATVGPPVPLTNSQTTKLAKSLEASNASMTQSVPELSLAQKLFSALTKVLQTQQTNLDGVLNLVR